MYMLTTTPFRSLIDLIEYYKRNVISEDVATAFRESVYGPYATTIEDHIQQGQLKR